MRGGAHRGHMSSTNAPVIGVAGVPDVARALREIGYTVITGPTFRDAAVAIAKQLSQSRIPVVVETLVEPGFAPWVTATNAKSGGLVLLPTNPEVDLTGQLASIRQIPLPATVGTLITALGHQAVLHDAAERVIPAPGVQQPPSVPQTVPVPSAPAPATSADPFVSSPVAAPVVTDPFANAAPVVSDPFAQPVQVVSDPFAQPVPVEDDFLALMNEGNTQPAPASDASVPQDDFLALMNDVVEQAPVMHVTPAPSQPFPDEDADFDAAMREVLGTQPQVTYAAPAPQPQVSPQPQPQLQQVAPQQQPQVVPQPQPQPQPAAYIEQPPTPFPGQPDTGAFTQRVEPVQPHVQPRVNVADFFGTEVMSTAGAKIIFSTAAKGGVGKTSQSLLYAQTAGGGGLRCLLIDANRDQGDIGTSLRIENAGFPTILAAIQGPPESAVIRKEQINERGVRPVGSQVIEFDVVLAPTRDYAGPRYASAAVYARVLDWAKTRYDVIVLDTQIIEALKSDIHEGLTIPELRAGAWNAGIAAYDYSAIKNAFAVFEELSALGVGPQRSLVVATGWPEREGESEKFNERFGHFGTFMGFVAHDSNFAAQKSVGNILVGSPAVAPVVRAVLHRVTGRNEFAPIQVEEKRKRFGLFGKRR